MTKSVKPPAELKKKVFSRAQLKLPKIAKGVEAETIAANFLVKKGYVVLEKNVRLGNFEIDLVALDRVHNELVFVEVKHRANEMHGYASESVGRNKINKMVKVARVYLQKKRLQKSYRFDIIAVVGDLAVANVEHFENITWL